MFQEFESVDYNDHTRKTNKRNDHGKLYWEQTTGGLELY